MTDISSVTPLLSDSGTQPNNAPSVRLWALVPCAGTGSRAGADGPKQYQLVAGQPMVLHTLAAFAAVPRLAEVMVVVSGEDDFFDNIGATCLIAACGGSTRAASVFNNVEQNPLLTRFFAKSFIQTKRKIALNYLINKAIFALNYFN